MLALLSDCTIVEQCIVIQFLESEGVKSSHIHRRMLEQYEENYYTKEGVPMGTKVLKWQNKHY
jgi:hypothetical protein